MTDNDCSLSVLEQSSTEDRTIILKNISTLETKLKTVKRRFAEGDIERNVYDEVKGDLDVELSNARAELAKYEESVSNLSKYTETVLSICSKLGGYWALQDFELCQKIQKLVFCDGALWDHNNRSFRTQGMNAVMKDILSLSSIYENAEVQKKDKPCDLSYLVEGQGTRSSYWLHERHALG